MPTQKQINKIMTIKKIKRDPTKGYKPVKVKASGGKRPKAGRKSKGELKKKALSIYVEPVLIATKEGRTNVRAVCASAIDVYKNNLNKFD